jgi:hypothetical protein
MEEWDANQLGRTMSLVKRIDEKPGLRTYLE